MKSGGAIMSKNAENIIDVYLETFFAKEKKPKSRFFKKDSKPKSRFFHEEKIAEQLVDNYLSADDPGGGGSMLAP
jgi:hypothetical protein